MTAVNKANKAYKTKRMEAFVLLKKLEAKLESHADRQAQESENWGYVGDLSHVIEKLGEITDFLQ